jgi:beta-phosphoglucomutase
MIRGVIFDLDGVLTDTAIYHYQSWSRIAKEINFDLTEELNEQLKGVSRTESLDRILSWAHTVKSAEEKQQLLIQKNEHYLALIESLSEKDILPGVVGFLDDIRRGGIKTAVGSSSKNAHLILKKLRLIDSFDAVVDGNMVKQTKPDPEVFTLAAELLGLQQRECMVVEDAEAGVLAAKAAGMKVLGITAHGKLELADFCTHSLLEKNTQFIHQYFS